jgi:hypothetical protein
MDAYANVAVDGTLTAARCVSASALPGGAGTGIYTVTLDRGLAAGELMPMLLPHTTATSAIGRITNTSVTIKTITFLDDAGAAVDTAFYFAAWRVAWGGH